MAERYIVYGRASCPYCTKATVLLESVDRPFIFLDYQDDLEFLEKVKQYYDSPTVPIILSNNLDSGYVSYIGGYSDLEGLIGGPVE